MMNPGIVLDALIAERVMGLTVEPHNNCSTILLILNKDNPLAWFHEPIKRYSTDISAAWEVVEKLRSKNMGVSVKTVWATENEIKWCVEIIYIDTGIIQNGPAEDTAPHAISLAAIRTVGIDL